MRKLHKSFLGFTLIELLLVMGLVAFLATMGVVTFGDFNKRQNLNIANDNLHNSLAQAKSFALSHVVNSTGIPDKCDTENIDSNLRESLVGYEVRIDSVNNTYIVGEVCLQSNGTDEEFTQVNKIQYLPPDIEFDSGNTSSNIRFNVLTGGAAGNYWVQFQETEGTRERAIEVTAEGVIRNADPR